MKDWGTILAASLQRQWKCYRKALRRCQRKFSEKAVHRSRIEARRLFSQLDLLSLFVAQRRFKKARCALKQHLDMFNPLRDTQVQLRLLRRYQDAFPETQQFHAALARQEKRCLKETARGIRHLKTGPLQKVVRALLKQLSARGKHPGRHARDFKAILAEADATFARVAERRRQMDPGQVSTIHRTRVAFKKFRYMVEALQPLYRDLTRQRLTAMRSFQRLLGELQDTDVFLDRLDQYMRKHKTRARQLAALRFWILRRRTAQIRRCLERADDIFKFWPLQKARGGGPPAGLNGGSLKKPRLPRGRT